VNNYFDGPFDQLPDNFLKGDELRQAILQVDPSLEGNIDSHGGAPDGASRYLIGPYMYYRYEEELLPIHQCAIDKKLPRDLYHACFVVRDDYQGDAEPETAKPAPAKKAPAKKASATKKPPVKK
jgi:hypothetical protein